jgi:hypothetical protein
MPQFAAGSDTTLHLSLDALFNEKERGGEGGAGGKEEEG